MSVSVTMPRLGESVSEGTVTRWLKKEGDHVEADEPLLEVSTDKVDTEIPSPAAGVLTSIKVAEDETVEVGSELAVIDEGGGGDGGEAKQEEQPAAEPEPEPKQEAKSEPEPEPEQQPEPAAEAPEPQRAGDDRTAESAGTDEQRKAVAQSEPAGDAGDDGDGDGGGPSYVTPLVRRLAAEHGVELSSVHGTGVGGRIRKQDVLDAARSNGGGAAQQRQPAQEQEQRPPQQQRPQPSQPAASVQPTPDTSVRGRTEKLSRLRTVIAQRMVESLQISAQLTTVVEADITKIARLRDRAKGEFEAREGVKLSFLPFFALATCEALREHPAVNSSIDVEGGTATYHDAVHLGIAVDTPRGLLVPVIKDASDLNLAGLARKIADLADRTRGNHITPDELGGGTFTLTNTGSRGALFDTPIINQPQVGILGTGSVVKRAVVVDDPDVGEVIAVRHMVYLALTYDHRMVDGADAARFLTTVKDRLEEGEFEAEAGL
jgi:pyruvate dehydrogenase E2 component (dihydrolipoamide acetyltransferase)